MTQQTALHGVWKKGLLILEFVDGQRVKIKAYRYLNGNRLELFAINNRRYIVYRNQIRRAKPIVAMLTNSMTVPSG